jgi:hypothetical protein
MAEAWQQGTIEASQITEPLLKVAIFGQPKSGKSWFAATAPGPILVYDFDERGASIAGRENVFVKTMVDRDPLRPTAWQQLETDLSTFKAAKIKGTPLPATFVFDSVTYMRKALENAIFYDSPNLCSSIKIGGRSVKIGRSFDYINAVVGNMEYMINSFAALGNVVFVYHETAEKDKVRSKGLEIVYTGRMTIDPNYLAKTLSLFNEVFHIEVTKEGKYEITTQPTSDTPTATTLRVDKLEKPDLGYLLAKHREAVAKTKK